MAKNSHIEWTHHTFNPWWGCKKVSPACDNCYAELWARRMGHRLWGTDSPRRFFGDAHWREPLKWNEDARIAGHRHRVFCASMADVFERRADLSPQRTRLWQLIEDTPNLDWLLLTKRPQNIARLAPWGTNWPVNVWVGTSVENQTLAEKRLPFLLKIPAAVRFLSCEPLLGLLDLRHWFKSSAFYPIDWIIAGGESGSASRPMHPDWVTSLLHQCQDSNVAFHFKQWGQWAPAHLIEATNIPTRMIELNNERPVEMVRMSKKYTGRTLEGSTWDGIPLTPHVHA
jgi:protein gp37